MRGSIIFLIGSLLLVHRPDQLEDSYLAPFAGVQAAPARAQEPAGASQSDGRPLQIVHEEKQHRRGLHGNASSQPEEESLFASGQPASSDKLLLLTDGRLLKLFPLGRDELAPTGGHYLIKPTTNFDLSDQRVVELLATNRRFLDWLQRRQKLIQAARLAGGRQRASILPQRRSDNSDESHEALLSDDELYRGQDGWRRPLISMLGHFFDARFCDSSGRERAANKSGANEQELPASAPNKLSGPSDCLVIYWLDRANKAFHLGAAKLNSTNQFRSLASGFDSRGVSSASRSMSSENVIELRPFAPLDLCGEASIEWAACQSLGVRVQSGSLTLHAALTQQIGNGSKPDGRLLSARLEPVVWSQSVAGLALKQKSIAQSEELFDALQVDPKSMKNLLRRSELSSQLLFLDGKPGLSTRIAAMNLELARSGVVSRSEPSDNKRIANVLDVQWETTKLKVRRSQSNKLDEPFSVLSMRLGSPCALVWLTSDNELYASDSEPGRAGGGPRFLGKLAAGRPLVRAPIVAMQLHRNSLLFIDSTRRSLMALKLAQPKSAGQLGEQFEHPSQLSDVGSRHEWSADTSGGQRVLLVEMLPIEDFELLVLGAHEQGAGRTADSCLGVSQLQWRHNEPPAQRHSHSSHREASSTGGLATRLATEAPRAETEAEPRVAHETLFSVPLDEPDDHLNLDKLQMALVICLLLSVIVLLASINCILWRQRAILVATRALETGHSTYSHYQLDEKPSKQ